MKTLREVSKLVGMSRRVIQEYESSGLAQTPTTKNEYGHLRYDDKSIERLWQIRFYRELGYKKKDLELIFNSPSYNMQDELEKQITLLEAKREEIEQLIKTAKAILKMPFTPIDLKFSMPMFRDASYDDTVSVYNVAAEYSPSEEEIDESTFINILTEDEEDKCWEIYEVILGFKEKGLASDDERVQDCVKQLYLIASKPFSGSIMFFSQYNIAFMPGTESAKDIDEMYGDGSSEYLFNAIYSFCIANENVEIDRVLIDAVNNIEELARMRYTTNSAEVQNEVSKIYDFCLQMQFYTPEDQLNMLLNMSKMYNSKEYKKIIDNGLERGVSWFISRAIEIFYNNIKKQKED